MVIFSWIVWLVPPAAIVAVLARIMFRPRLEFTITSKDCQEDVVALPGKSALAPTSLSAPLGLEGVPHRMVRAFVYNTGWLRAKSVEVFLDRILHNGRTIENRRARLCWKGPVLYEHFDTLAPKSIDGGKAFGYEIDICGSDRNVPGLQIKSELGMAGYGYYQEPGIYTFDLSARSVGIYEYVPLSIEVSYDGPGNLSIGSAVAGRRRFVVLGIQIWPRHAE